MFRRELMKLQQRLDDIKEFNSRAEAKYLPTHEEMIAWFNQVDDILAVYPPPGLPVHILTAPYVFVPYHDDDDENVSSPTSPSYSPNSPFT
jgi:hypothetical protein